MHDTQTDAPLYAAPARAEALSAEAPLGFAAALGRFGLSQFRHSQRAVIEAVLAGHDVLAVMPTGAGKSLCYQLPATLIEGVTVVVSPLISLMKDQVDALTEHGIAAAELTSALSDYERNERLQALASGALKIVYVAPERFRSPRFLDAMKQLRIGLFAIDEAHCVSQWGHDFRPDYLRLGAIIAELNPERRMALTATATPEVRDDIGRLLGFNDPKVFVRGFDRPNLHFGVESVAAKAKATRVAELVREVSEGSAITYVGTRKNAEKLAVELRAEGLKTGVYHAGLPDEERVRVQDGFMEDAFDVLVATNAFGMGVDKSDVRLVVHADVPRSLEAYYQEAGRAGRDGLPAECRLLFNGGDVRLQEYFIESSYPSAEVLRQLWRALRNHPEAARNPDALAEAIGAKNTLQLDNAIRHLLSAGLLVDTGSATYEATRPPPDAPQFDPESLGKRAELETKKLARMTGYAYSNRCRRYEILAYFGDEAAGQMRRCGSCDNCSERPSRPLDKREREQLVALLQLVDRTDSRYGRTRLVQILMGEDAPELRSRGLDRLPEFGVMGAARKDTVFELIARAEASGLLSTEPGEYPTLLLTGEGAAALRNPAAVTELTVVQPRAGKAGAGKAGAGKLGSKAKRSGGLDLGVPEAALDPELVDKLRTLRTELAREEQRPPFMIWSNKTLELLARVRPKSLSQLMTISGMGEHKTQSYGQRIVALFQ